MLWDRAVCITLGDEERMRGIRELPFPVEFFQGCDMRGASLDSRYDATRRTEYGRAHLTPAEVGCAISHREVARSVVETGKRTLVLEDDVMLVGEILESAPDFDLCYLGWRPMNMTVPLSTRFKFPYYMLKGNWQSVRRIYAKRINDQWLRAGWFNGAYAYIIDPPAARYIVELQERIWLEADTALSYLARFSGLNAIATNRPAFDVRDVPSSIGARESWH